MNILRQHHLRRHTHVGINPKHDSNAANAVDNQLYAIPERGKQEAGGDDNSIEHVCQLKWWW